MHTATAVHAAMASVPTQCKCTHVAHLFAAAARDLSASQRQHRAVGVPLALGEFDLGVNQHGLLVGLVSHDLPARIRAHNAHNMAAG
jgi:hypothetical protein